MKTRKQMKHSGRTSLKKHYFIFVAACLIAAFLSSEFRSSLNFFTAYDYEAYDQIETEASEDGSYNIKTEVSSVSWEHILMIIDEDDTRAGREVSREVRNNAIRKAEDGNPALMRSRGVLAAALNQISSGSVIVTAVSATASVTGSEDIGVMVLIILAALGMALFWFFIQNVFPVVIRRVFLEGLIYDRVTPQRFVFLLRVRKWLKASWIMFVKYIYYTLWSLTIIGIAVKRYSYYLVPYIAAENPDMTATQAITLSRRMMDGHKWQCFIFELSFIGWEILGALTLGLANIFFVNPYKISCFTQYYAAIREEALEKEIPGSHLLFDRYLYKKADPSTLDKAYSDVLNIINTPDPRQEKLQGWRGVLAGHLGILLLRREEDRLYEKHQADHVRIFSLIDDAEGNSYPVRLYPIPKEERRKLVQSLNYMRHYSIWSLTAIFFSLSFLGWLWEAALHLIADGVFVNRGALHGPWLPIYGTGALLMLTVLYRFRKHPVLTFTMTVVLCGILEYVTSFAMELVTGGTKWWDYSGYFLNLHGRICAEGLLVFGIGGLAIVYILAPVIDSILDNCNEKILQIVCIVLLLLFLCDAVYSYFDPNTGAGITDYEHSSNPSDTLYSTAGEILFQFSERL